MRNADMGNTTADVNTSQCGKGGTEQPPHHQSVAYIIQSPSRGFIFCPIGHENKRVDVRMWAHW